MIRREHALQIAVAHMLQIVLDPTRTWWTAIDHGVGRLGKAEAGIRKRRGVKPGIPDFIILSDFNSGALYCVLGIELKTGKGKVTEIQSAVGDAWYELGHRAFVARSLKGVQQILDRCKVPCRSRINTFEREAANVFTLRSKTTRHRRPKRRPAKDLLPVVFADEAQK